MDMYKQIGAYIKDKYGYTPKSCWIAHMKEVCGLNPRVSPRRHNPAERKHPCPAGKQDDLREAFVHFKMI